jgi:hypothetical protein
VFVDGISVSAMLYIINFANLYQNGTKKDRKYLFGEYTRKIIGVSGKLRTLYNPFVIMKRLYKGALGGSERIMGIPIISYGEK